MLRSKSRRFTRRAKKQSGGKPRTEKAKRAQARSQERLRQQRENNIGAIVPDSLPIEGLGNTPRANAYRVNNARVNNNNRGSIVELTNIEAIMPLNNQTPSFNRTINKLRKIKNNVSALL